MIKPLGSALLIAYVASAARSDTRADSLLAVVQQTYKRSTSLNARIEKIETDANGRTIRRSGRILLQKPNLARIRFDGEKEAVLNSDGKTVRAVGKPPLPTDPEGQNIAFSIPVSLFFGQPVFKSFPYSMARLRHTGKERIAGTFCDVIELAIPKPIYQTIRLYIGPDRLIHRQVVITSVPHSPHTISEQNLTGLILNKNIPFAAFQPREPGSPGFSHQPGRLRPGLPTGAKKLPGIHK